MTIAADNLDFINWTNFYKASYKANFTGTCYSNSTGGFTDSGVEVNNHDNAVPFSGITLLNAAASYYGNCEGSYGSSQTKQAVFETTDNASLASAEKVLVGGVSRWESTAFEYGSINCTYATYTAM